MTHIEYLRIATRALISDNGEIAHSHESRSTYRYQLCHRFAWAIPTPAALTEIAAYGPIVEIGAGTGYWARLLRESDVNIVAYDLHPPVVGAEDNHWHQNVPTWTQVLPGSPECAAYHPDRALLLCWPPRSPMAHEALSAYRGDYIIYIGEESGGCTADNAFFDSLKRNWRRIKVIDIPRWWDCYDKIIIYRRATHDE